jgi:hypothetical protein
MITMVNKKVYLRPIKSPSRPKNKAPKGLTTKPAAKVASVDNRPSVGFPAGKNLVAMTAARLPKM